MTSYEMVRLLLLAIPVVLVAIVVVPMLLSMRNLGKSFGSFSSTRSEEMLARAARHEQIAEHQAEIWEAMVTEMRRHNAVVEQQIAALAQILERRQEPP